MKRKISLVLAIVTVVCLMTVLLVGCVENASSVTIDNKSELTAEWYEGDADRTIKATFASEEAEVAAIVTSSDSKVVAANGMKLTAKSAGTATITVKSGNDSDSVEITVKPVLKSVAITNKQSLIAVWLVGDADRTVEVALNPDDFTEANTTVTVTSSDTSVISVSGKTLHALKQGSATITVSAGNYSDTVEVSVLPAVETLAIANKAELTATWNVNTSRTLQLTATPDEYTAEILAANATIESSDTEVVSVDGLKVSALKPGTATITVSLGNKTDSVEVNVVATAPKIALGYVEGLKETDDGYFIGVAAGTEATLPTATATTWDGNTVDVKVDYGTLDPDSNNIVVADKGVYNIVYTATDSRDGNLVSTLTLKFVSARKLFAKTDGNFSITNELDEDSKQTVTVTNNGFQNAQFNLQASKLYYAEVTFEVSNPSADNLVGLAHFVPTDVNANKDYTRWLASIVDRGNRDHRVVDFDTAHAWSVVNQTTSYYQWRLAEYRGLPDNDASLVTYAIARDGDYFYTFVNGAYVDCVTLEHYRDNDTVPGIFGLKMDASTLKNIVFTDGEEAQTKLNALLKNGAAMITPYAPGNWAAASLGDGLINAGEVTEEKGVNFTYTSKNQDFNGGLVSPYIYFDKDFSFEWTYKSLDCNTAGWSNPLGMLLEVRKWNYDGNQLLQFGMRNDGDNSCLMIGNNKAKEKTQKYTGADFTDADGNSFDVSKGVTFKLVRRVWSSKTVFTMTITSVANPSQTYTDTYDCTMDGWNEALLLSWHNTLCSGEYTNIKWEVLDPVLENVEIAEKEQLSKIWFLGEDDREIKINFMPDTFTADTVDVQLTSSRTDVVTIVEGKLHAVGAGTTTITLTVGNFTDTVEVTVLPAVDELTLNVTDSGLTLEKGETFTLIPTVSSSEWTAEMIAANIAITAKDDGYVSVKGYKITALEVGETEIAATLGGKSVTFKIVVTGNSPQIDFSSVDGFTSSVSGGTLNAYQGQAVMPTATAKSWQEKDIAVKIIYPEGFVVSEDGTVTAQNGTYEVTYIATDPDDDTLVTEKVIVVNIARKVFGATDNTWSIKNAFVADEQQVAQTSNTGFTIANFNIAASKLYYAEVTFNVSDPSGNVLVGLAHFVPADNNARWLATVVDRGNRDHRVKDFDTSQGWSIASGTSFYQYQLAGYRGLPDNDAGKVTWAIARDGDYFYTFVNGSYVDCVTFEHYRDNDTLPGIFGLKINNSSMENIVYVDGEEAQSKIDGLLRGGAAMITPYVPAAWASKSLENKNLLVVGETTEEKGLNFAYNFKNQEGVAEPGWNEGMISPYIYFDKDFSVEWTYRNTANITQGWANPLGSVMVVRPWNYADQLLQCGIRTDGDRSKIMLGNNKANEKTQKYTGANLADTEGNTFDVSQGITFKVTRRVEADKAVFTMTITSVATPTQTYTETYDCTVSGWDGPVLINWQNNQHAGEYTNVKWEVLK